MRKLNSDRVDGWDGDALLNQAIVLTDDDTSTVHLKGVAWSLDQVPPGRYLITWSVHLSPIAAGSEAYCGVVAANPTRDWALEFEDSKGAWPVPLGGSAVVTFDPEAMRFACISTTTPIKLAAPLTVAFQPLSQVQDLPLTLLETPS